MKHLDRILALTDAIEARVADGEWSVAAGLDRERRELLAEALADAPEALSLGNARGLLEQLLARNEATVARVTAARAGLDDEARRTTAGVPALHAYQLNGTDRASLPGDPS